MCVCFFVQTWYESAAAIINDRQLANPSDPVLWAKWEFVYRFVFQCDEGNYADIVKPAYEAFIFLVLNYYFDSKAVDQVCLCFDFYCESPDPYFYRRVRQLRIYI